MATTFIDYKNDKGFWIAEIYMELVFEYIYQVYQNFEDEGKFEKELNFYYEFTSKGYSKGMLTLLWGNFLKSKEDEGMMIRLLEDTNEMLKEKGEYISTEELNRYEVKKDDVAVKWPKPLRTSEIIKIINTLILMLKGEWEETRYGMDIDYSFID